LPILFRSKRQRQGRKRAQPYEKPALPGLDSEFYELVNNLAERLPVRQEGEPLSGWIQHARRDPQLAPLSGQLDHLLQLHYTYRFDPEGLNPARRELLRHETRACLTRLKSDRESYRVES